MPDDLNKLSKKQLIALVIQLVNQNEQLAEQNKQLTEQVDQLQDRLACLEKNSSNSSKPPSSDIIDPQPKNKTKRKRKVGGQRGHKKHTRQPFSQDDVNKTIVHALPDDVIKRRKLVALNETESALQQIDLPKQLFNVIEHRVQLYRGPHGEIVKAILPVSIRQAGLFSPRLTALTGYLKARGHMSYSTLQAFYRDIMSLDVSQSYLVKVCTQKLSVALKPAYAKVAEYIRNADVVGSDETGHKNFRGSHSNPRGPGANKHATQYFFISATRVVQRYSLIFLVLISLAPSFVTLFQPTKSLLTTTIFPFSSASRI